jgi:hypothetical protein
MNTKHLENRRAFTASIDLMVALAQANPKMKGRALRALDECLAEIETRQRQLAADRGNGAGATRHKL